MCGRFSLMTDVNVILERFQIQEFDPISYRKNYNIAPGQSILAVVNDGVKNKAGLLRWGLVPYWAQDPSIGYKMINARSETVDVKKSFKRLFTRRRCLIVADGFYEWKEERGKKLPFRIKLKNDQPFAFAGLWDRWEKNGENLTTCTILTTEANSIMKDIHNRMPVILTPETEKIWLNPKNDDPNLLKQLLTKYSSKEMETYRVSTIVNSSKNNFQECVKPI